MNLPGFGADRYRKIAPYVTALPSATVKINVCTAPAVVIESLADSLSGEYTDEVLANGRKSGCFPDVATLTAVLGQECGSNRESIRGHEPVFPSHYPGHAWHYGVHLVQSFVARHRAAR